MFQTLLTPAAGKRLIAKALPEQVNIKKALKSGTIVIIAGSTNGYVAEELLGSIGQGEGFRRSRFFRGLALPPASKTTESGRLPDESAFPGDVVIEKGVWRKGKTIFDVAGDLSSGDVILKGANCVDPSRKKAGILIGHPRGGTIASAIQAVVGKRVKLILPAGLEKRVAEDPASIADLLNAPDATGPRMFPVSGEIVTEIEAIEMLFHLSARLVAAGGVGGAEGSVWLALEGEAERVEEAKSTLMDLAKEVPFDIR